MRVFVHPENICRRELLYAQRISPAANNFTQKVLIDGIFVGLVGFMVVLNLATFCSVR